MKKAEMLEEIRCKLSLLVEEKSDKKEWYQEIIHFLSEEMRHYQAISIYLTDESSFNYFCHVGDDKVFSEDRIPFGDEMLSIVAAKGEITCDFFPGGQTILIPFYNKHHLIGEMIIKVSQFVDDEEQKFFKKIQDILNLAPK